jgi:hypothetical protein
MVLISVFPWSEFRGRAAAKAFYQLINQHRLRPFNNISVSQNRGDPPNVKLRIFTPGYTAPKIRYLPKLHQGLPGPGLLSQTMDFNYPRIHRPQINAKYCLTMRQPIRVVVYPNILDKGGQPGSYCLSLTMRAAVTHHVSNLTSKHNRLS